MKRSKGFTLVELLVVVAIIGLLISMLMPTLARARELARQAMCGTNLNGVGKALAMYGAENNSAFPMICKNSGVKATGLGWKTSLTSNADVYSLGQAPGTGPIFPLDNLNLLVYKKNLGWKIFLCPSTVNAIKDRSALANADLYGFGKGAATINAGKDFIDYALQVPQQYIAPNIENKAWLGSNTSADLAIMADRGWSEVGVVTPEASRSGNTGLFGQNHPKDGENVLFMNGNVGWCNDAKFDTSTPPVLISRNTAGINYNNIYLKDVALDGTVNQGTGTVPAPTEAALTDTDSILVWESTAD